MGFTYPYLLSPGGMALPGFLKSSSGSRRSSSAISPRELPFPPSAKPPVGTSSGVSGRSPGMSLVASARGISPSKSTPSLSEREGVDLEGDIPVAEATSDMPGERPLTPEEVPTGGFAEGGNGSSRGEMADEDLLDPDDDFRKPGSAIPPGDRR